MTDEDDNHAAWFHHDEGWLHWSDEQLREENARILSYWCVVKWNPKRAKFELLEDGYGR